MVVNYDIPVTKLMGVIPSGYLTVLVITRWQLQYIADIIPINHMFINIYQPYMEMVLQRIIYLHLGDY